MSVVANKVGNNAVVTITVDITDILALPAPATAADKKRLALERVRQELNNAYEAVISNDAQLDARVTALSTYVAAAKTARPTGNL